MANHNIPKSWTTVTPLSKYLAMALFVLLPYLGFYMGIQYEKLVTPDYPPTQYITSPPVMPKIKPVDSSSQKCGGINAELCPKGFTCQLHTAEPNAAGTCVDQNGTASQPVTISPGTPSQEQVACTEEAKLCSDGSYVGREGPNCEFAVCPTN